jgi:type IX secretion system substrate protein
MKKLIIFILFFSCLNGYSQDKEPSKYDLIWGASTTPRPLEVDSFNIDRIKLGFQWSGSTQMSNALLHNIVHGGDPSGAIGIFDEGMHTISQPNIKGIRDMAFIQYEPTLVTSDFRNFNTRHNDPTNAIFGFGNVYGTIMDSSFSGNNEYNRLQLFQDSLSVYPPDKIVLSGITPKTEFFTLKGSGQIGSYNGEKWNLSINLRNLDLTDSAMTDDIVLVIKLPFVAVDSTGDTTGLTTKRYIKFDYLSKDNFYTEISPLDTFEFRGYAYDTVAYNGSNPIDSIVITRKMLGFGNDVRDITISTHFSCTQKETPTNFKYYNPRFIPGFKEESPLKEFELIHKIDIEVKYYGNCDVGIDWIRIENDKAQQTLRGNYDAYDKIKIQEHLNNLSYALSGVKLHRLYNQDTESTNPTWWGQSRYWNLVTNGVTITRDGLTVPEAYKYYTKAPNRWIGVGYMSDDALMPSPYIRNGSQNKETMFLKSGFAETDFADSLNSEYEMRLSDERPWSDLLIDSVYNKQVDHSDVLQARYEYEIRNSYFDPIKNKLLFSGDEWYFYDLLFNVVIDTTGWGTGNWRIKHSFQRVKTFEEWTLQNYGALINGCRGFIHDGDQGRFFPELHPGNYGLGDFRKLDSNNGIYSNIVGDDFINSEFNTWNAYPYTPDSLFSAHMEIPKDRIYIGTKSYRDALFQFNTFVRAAESTLMKLKLAATFSKGYRELYAQDEAIYGTDTLLNDFVEYDKESSYTKRLYQRFPGDSTFEESYDSSFFNMTILKEDNVPLDSVYYIAIQNRRTDPLVYFTNPQDTSEKYLKFFSSAEFRDSCINSPDSLVYQDYWWKRLGAREFTLPVLQKSYDSVNYNLVKISELGANDMSLNSLWHRDSKYYDLIDTVIGQDKTLSFRLLPGQGKILKVEVLKPDIVEGFLDNYNQNNLVEYRDPLDPNMIVYHLAFYKNSKRPNDTSKVYKEVHYIRSFPIAKNSFSENIIWDSTSRINLSKHYFESINILNPKYDDCNHPALVVREDSSGLPHPFIVYTCKDSAVTQSGKGRVILAKVSPYGGSVVSNDVIFRLSFNDIDRFGTPTINASADGNYIAWTDSLRGLFVAYQKKNDHNITDLDSITLTEFSTINPEGLLFPSFNTYSHIDSGENNAGLVWYQAVENQGGIYYSRVSFDAVNDTIILNIPDNYVGQSILTKDINSKMMYVSPVSYQTDYSTKPIIYRSLGNYNLTGVPWCQYNRYDNINWIDYLIRPAFSDSRIMGKTIYHRDSLNTNQSWSSSKINEISFSGLQKDIIVNSINSAQQDGLIIDNTEMEIGGNFNLNITLDSAIIYQFAGFNGSNFLKNNAIHYEGNYPMVSPRRASYGNMVQLAKSKKPNFSENFDMWKNRRIFESDEQDTLGNPIIKSSAHLFYKAAYTETIDNHVFYGFSGDSNNVYFDIPKFEDDPSTISSFPVKLNSHPISSDPCTFILNDSPSLSFIMPGLILKDANSDGEKEMEISIYGFKNSDISVILERAYDSAQVVLTMPPITTYPIGATKLIYSILDSTTSEFNLIFQNNDTTAYYNEKAFIGGMENIDTISYKSAIQKNPTKYIIDFNNGGIQYEARNINDFELTVYPNPTSGNLRVQAFLPEKLDGYKFSNRSLVITVYDATGRMVTSQNGATGQMFDFDISNSPSGAYIINVEHSEGNNKFTARERIVKE